VVLVITGDLVMVTMLSSQGLLIYTVVLLEAMLPDFKEVCWAAILPL